MGSREAFLLCLVLCLSQCTPSLDIFRLDKTDPYSARLTVFPTSRRLSALAEVRSMFIFAYDCYMTCAFPQDELDPIACRGRGPDKENPSNININDVLGDYSLSLVESLGTLALMGNASEFQRAIRLVVENVSFDRGSTVQVFEANIRVLGGLLSAHLLMEDPKAPFGQLTPEWYRDDLLSLSTDLANRLLSAFRDSKTNLPHPRVNLDSGVPPGSRTDTCTAGAGSLLMEFGMLSQLLGDPTYENHARGALYALWTRRDNVTGLLGNVLDVDSGEWINKSSGLGAGADSFFEYLLKSFILFRRREDLDMFLESYAAIKKYLRAGRRDCNKGGGMHPLYVNVDMASGQLASHWIDSLQAAFSGLQVLHGDLEEAICHHALYYGIWKTYGFLPERYNWKLNAPDVAFYPLRPEFAESTYFLYRATRNPFYLHVGSDILSSLNTHSKSNCGYATIHDVNDMSLEDRQESFFLSETLKYLLLLFDEENPLHRPSVEDRYIFTTEGHVFPILLKPKDSFKDPSLRHNNSNNNEDILNKTRENPYCQNHGINSRHSLPLKPQYLSQMFAYFSSD